MRSEDHQLEDQISKERERHFSAAMRQLPLDHFKVIMLRRLNNLSIRDTAQVLKRSEAAVKMLYLRASEALQRLLSQDPYFSEVVREVALESRS